MTDLGYGQLTVLLYAPGQRELGAILHRQLARRGAIVLDPEPVVHYLLSDVERAALAALERAKMRAAAAVEIIHRPDGSLDATVEEDLEYATHIGKTVHHHYPNGPSHG